MIQKMKKIFSVVFFTIMIFGNFSFLQAQEKFAHINTEQLLRQMPGRQQAQEELQRYAQELETQFTAMQTEFQTKYQDFLENESTYSDLIKQSKQRELGSLQERITEFQESAQQDLAQRENQLLQPIIDQARTAIEDVAKEQGYTYVFDMSAGSLLYANPGDNILPLVKDKLGIEGDVPPVTLPTDTMGNP